MNELLAYAITLKIMKPDIFQHLSRDNGVEAHKEAKESIDKLNQNLNRTRMAELYLDPLSEWHVAHINDFKEEEIGNKFKLIHDNLYKYNIQRENIFPILADQIDLSIE